MKLAAPLVSALLLTASAAAAQTITLIHEGVGTGELAGVPFTQAPFTITCTADLADVTPLPAPLAGAQVAHQLATIEIAGVATVDFLTSTRTFVNNGLSLVGFSRTIVSGSDLFNGPGHVQLTTWDLTTATGPLTGSGSLVQWEFNDPQVSTTGGVLTMDDDPNVPATFRAYVGPPPTNYCTAQPNSTGAPASISATGSLVAASNDLALHAAGIPPGQFGIFLTSMTQGSSPVGAGTLCLGGSIIRFQAPGQVLQASPGGEFSLQVDLTALPAGTPVAVAAGETWSFQAWFRDVDPMLGNIANFTDGLEVSFL